MIGNGAQVRRHGRLDLEALKQTHPIHGVVSSYGIVLRRQGRAGVGRCPLHQDQGRPNLHVWSDTQSWFCFRCNVGGDAVRFVELAEGVSFREAVDRLTSGTGIGHVARGVARFGATPLDSSTPPLAGGRDPEELAVLRTASSLYHHRLLADPTAFAYVEQRGLDRATVEAFRIGFVAGDELLPLLRWQHLPLAPALRVGLLNHTGRETL